MVDAHADPRRLRHPRAEELNRVRLEASAGGREVDERTLMSSNRLSEPCFCIRWKRNVPRRPAQMAVKALTRI